MRATRLLAAAVVAAGCSSSATHAPAASKPKTLVLLHTNDEHSHLIGLEPELDDHPAATAPGTGAIRGGVGRRAVLLAQERQRAADLGADTLTVSAGDLTMGTLMEALTTVSAPDYAAARKLGYDVITFGNHELDWGPAALAQAIAVQQRAPGGMVPIVSSNIHFSATDAGDDALAALFDASGSDASLPIHRSWVVTTSQGIKVGFVGIMGADAQNSAPFRLPVQFSTAASHLDADYPGVLSQLYLDLQPVVDHLRDDLGVDLVVALSHSGVNAPGDDTGEDNLIAQHVSGIDVIVSGHSHTLYPATLTTNLSTGKPVLIQQAGSFGDHLGRIQLTVDQGHVTFDMADSKVLPIDDRIVSDPAYDAFIDGFIQTLEQPSGGPSFLEHTLSAITGTAVVDGPTIGDLYFYELGHTTFDVTGQGFESPLLVLSADAMLTAVEALGHPTDVALQASGVIRGDLDRGKTGELAFADVFKTLSLGISPADGSVGYPICRFGTPAVGLLAALELVASYPYSGVPGASGYVLVPAGLKFEYDTGRPPFDSADPLDLSKGRVTRITLAKDHAQLDDYAGANGQVIFDRAQGGFVGISPTDLVIVAASLYIAQFAAAAGVPLLDPTTGQALSNPALAIVKRGDQSELKDYEALGAFILQQSALNGGELPPRYDRATGTFPRRDLCTGPLCTP